MGASVVFLVNCSTEAQEDVFSLGVKHPASIGIDASGSGRIFFVDHTDNKIRSANFDGGEVGELQAAQSLDPHSVAVDTAAEKIYWTDNTAGKVLRANYDGLDVEDVARNLDGPTGIAVVRDCQGTACASVTKVVWGCQGSMKIQTADVPSGVMSSGLPPVADLATAAADVFGVALDASQGYVYWTLQSTGKIQRAPIAGGSARDIVVGLDGPESIAVNPAHSIYWSEPNAGTISRASAATSTAGSNLEVVVASSAEPRGLAFDADAGILYFGDSTDQGIRRVAAYSFITGDGAGECLLYRALGGADIGFIILAVALGVAVCACFVSCGCLAKSRGSKPVADAKTAETAAGSPPPDVEKDAEKSSPPAPPDTAEEQAPPAADADAPSDQDIAPLHSDEEAKEAPGGLQNMAEPAASPRGEPASEGRGKQDTGPEVVEPELDNPRKGGGLCFFCAGPGA